MRQMTMLSLTVHSDFSKEFENFTVLTPAALKIINQPWPVDVAPVQERDQGEEEDDAEEHADEEETKTIDKALYKNNGGGIGRVLRACRTGGSSGFGSSNDQQTVA